jgi:hypothetical protein
MPLCSKACDILKCMNRLLGSSTTTNRVNDLIIDTLIIQVDINWSIHYFSGVLTKNWIDPVNNMYQSLVIGRIMCPIML